MPAKGLRVVYFVHGYSEDAYDQFSPRLSLLLAQCKSKLVDLIMKIAVPWLISMVSPAFWSRASGLNRLRHSARVELHFTEQVLLLSAVASPMRLLCLSVKAKKQSKKQVRELKPSQKAKKSGEDSATGWLSDIQTRIKQDLMKKVAEMIEVNIANFHIRFEDSVTQPVPYACGFKLGYAAVFANEDNSSQRTTGVWRARAGGHV
ncbi:unnamed protein product [Symbiodinium sp. CCMP2592]|nr:unnamed protein product [Symbiodinium sp. CCMP2592]